MRQSRVVDDGVARSQRSIHNDRPGRRQRGVHALPHSRQHVGHARGPHPRERVPRAAADEAGAGAGAGGAADGSAVVLDDHYHVTHLHFLREERVKAVDSKASRVQALLLPSRPDVVVGRGDVVVRDVDEVLCREGDGVAAVGGQRVEVAALFAVPVQEGDDLCIHQPTLLVHAQHPLAQRDVTHGFCHAPAGDDVTGAGEAAADLDRHGRVCNRGL